MTRIKRLLPSSRPLRLIGVSALAGLAVALFATPGAFGVTGHPPPDSGGGSSTGKVQRIRFTVSLNTALTDGYNAHGLRIQMDCIPGASNNNARAVGGAENGVVAIQRQNIPAGTTAAGGTAPDSTIVNRDSDFDTNETQYMSDPGVTPLDTVGELVYSSGQSDASTVTADYTFVHGGPQGDCVFVATVLTASGSNTAAG